jgi:hypothetical protein
MDNLFINQKYCNHNNMDTVDKHHAFYVRFRKYQGRLSWDLNLPLVYMNCTMNNPIRMTNHRFFWQFPPGQWSAEPKVQLKLRTFTHIGLVKSYENI